MSESRDIQFLNDIREAARLIDTFIAGMSTGDFLGDEKTKAAVVRYLEVIGEAAKNVSKAVKKRYPDAPWKDMSRMRDKLIHHYFGVNYDIVWEVVQSDLPSLVKEIVKILIDLDPSGTG